MGLGMHTHGLGMRDEEIGCLQVFAGRGDAASEDRPAGRAVWLLLRLVLGSRPGHKKIGVRLACTLPCRGRACAEQGHAGDCKQRPLVPRSRCSPRLMPGVRRRRTRERQEIGCALTLWGTQ